MLNLYLDNCCFNRPFDDQTQTKIKIETLAKLSIQRQIINERYRLVWSYILQYENMVNPYSFRRENINKWEDIAQIYIGGDDKVDLLIQYYENRGIRLKDAAHLACAEYAMADYFITTDSGILKKANLSRGQFKIVSPVDFITAKGD